MMTKTLAAIAALALIGGSAAAFADGDHSHSGPMAQGEAAPGAQSHRHGENRPMQMADMHARMSSMHGAASEHGGGMHRGNVHMFEKAPDQTPAPSTTPAK